MYKYVLLTYIRLKHLCISNIIQNNYNIPPSSFKIIATGKIFYIAVKDMDKNYKLETILFLLSHDKLILDSIATAQCCTIMQSLHTVL